MNLSAAASTAQITSRFAPSPLALADRDRREASCETSKVLRRRFSEIRYRVCRRSISGDAKNGLIEPEAGDRSKIFAICWLGREQRGRSLEALATPGCFSKEQWFRL
jgi:hypothetical protein